MISEFALSEAYLESIYLKFSHEYNRDHQNQNKYTLDSISLTYGELLPLSIGKLLSRIRYTPEDVWVDLGSGKGKLLFHLFLATELKHLVGIEANPSLYNLSVQVKESIQVFFPEYFKEKDLRLTHADFLKTDLSDATIIYMCSTCFSHILLDKIGEKLNHLPQLKQVISLKPIPTLTSIPFKEAFSVECSWDSALAYYYSRL